MQREISDLERMAAEQYVLRESKPYIDVLGELYFLVPLRTTLCLRTGKIEQTIEKTEAILRYEKILADIKADAIEKLKNGYFYGYFL
jgi:hypothetical protein